MGSRYAVKAGQNVTKYLFIIVLSVLSAIGLAALMIGFASGKSETIFFGAVFSTISVTILLVGLKLINLRMAQLKMFSTHTFDSYKNKHPELVKNDSVECFSCGCKRIAARSLLNRTYHREHFCSKCGKTLYYSPEQNI